jgi:hypothetical protein
MDTIDASSVHVETNDKLKKAKLEVGFYNIIDGERASASKTLSVVNPATGKQLVQCIIDLQSISLLNLLGVSKTVEIGAA